MVHEKFRLRGFQKIYVGRLFSGYLKYPLSWGFLRVLGAWMTFKKADMAKTLKIRFSMIETNPLNHKWLDFVILTGLVLHQFQTKWLLSKLFFNSFGKSKINLSRSTLVKWNQFLFAIGTFLKLILIIRDSWFVLIVIQLQKEFQDA